MPCSSPDPRLHANGSGRETNHGRLVSGMPYRYVLALLVALRFPPTACCHAREPGHGGRARTTATPHPDDVTGRLVRSSGSIGCTLCRSSCAIPDLGRAAGWLFGLPPGRISIFESVLGRPAELSEMRRCQNALYHHTEQEIAPRIDDSRYAPSAAAHAIQAFQTLRDLSLMICTLRVCE